MSEFQLRLRRRNMPDEELLADLRETAARLAVSSITRHQYDEHGSFGATTILRRVGPWNVALALAGLSVVHRQHIPDEELFENIAAVWTALGRQPFGRHMSDKVIGSRFALGTYEKRFGTWNNALVAFVDFIGNIKRASESSSDDARFVRSVREKRSSRKVNWRLRARILIRDSCICKMCGASPLKDGSVTLHVDHILAWDLGGETVEENLQVLCQTCNIGKSNVELREVQS